MTIGAEANTLRDITNGHSVTLFVGDCYLGLEKFAKLKSVTRRATLRWKDSVGLPPNMVLSSAAPLIAGKSDGSSFLSRHCALVQVPPENTASPARFGCSFRLSSRAMTEGQLTLRRIKCTFCLLYTRRKSTVRSYLGELWVWSSSFEKNEFNWTDFYLLSAWELISKSGDKRQQGSHI